MRVVRPIHRDVASTDRVKVLLDSGTSSACARVLLVDDDGAMVRLMRQIVERLGHHCVTAESGEAALDELEAGRFDLLVTDINMGGVSGLELLDRARALDPDLAVMVVSGIAEPGTAEAALAGGAFGYVVKPFDVMELQIAVSNALRRRELELELRAHLQDLETEIDRRTAQLQKAMKDAQTQEQRFRSLAQASPLGIVYADVDGHLEYCNSNAEALLGRTGDRLAGLRWLQELDAVQREDLESAIRKAIVDLDGSSCECEVRRHDGSTIWLQSRVAPVLDDEQNGSGVVVLFEDIASRKRLEEQLRHQATHDHLTGLPNRREFRSQLAHQLMALGEDEILGVLMVDLDQFKLVNDTYGHEAGDQLIVKVGERLVQAVPSGSLVARLGGDEYVIAVCAENRDRIVSIAQKVRRVLRQRVRIMDVELSLSVSVGIGTTTDPAMAVSHLLRSADIAMHHAKKHRDVVEVFDHSMSEDVARRLALTSELRRAVDEDLLSVHYQPIVDSETEEVRGFEALARWNHEEWGQVSPGEFIPIAESMGIVHQIDSRVLRTAVDQMARWRRAGVVELDVFMSVNLSASQLSNSALPDLVFASLQEAGLEGRVLCIEVTESSLISDLERAVPIMRRLQALGVRIAVDDFGTGHSSLSYLDQLPLDVLKIDGSFIAAIGSSHVDVVAAIVDLAHSFELEVIAEQVETTDQLDRLRVLGCDLVQGYLTGRPARPDSFFAPLSPAVGSSVPPRNEVLT